MRFLKFIIFLLIFNFFWIFSTLNAEEKVKLHFFGIKGSQWVGETVLHKIQDYFKAIIEINAFITMVEKEEKVEEKREEKKDEIINPQIASASELLWEGKELMNKKKKERAIEKFLKSREIFRKNLANLEDFDLYIDVLFQLANAFFEAGYEDNGYEVLEKILVLRPDFTIDKTQHIKSFVQAVERVKNKLLRLTMGDVFIKASPSDANIYVDGIFKGSGEVLLKNLPRGRHFLRVKKEGYNPYNDFFVTPLAGKKLDLNIVLKEGSIEEREIAKEALLKVGLGDYLQRGDFGSAFKKLAWETGKKMNVDFLLFGYLTKSSISYHLAFFFFSVEKKEIIAFDPAVLDLELSNLQLVLLEEEQKVISALKDFPSEKIIYGRPSIYAISLQEEKIKETISKKQEVKEHAFIEKEEAKAKEEKKIEIPEKKEIAKVIHHPISEIPKDLPLVKKRAKWYKKWWVWSIVGGVAVAGGVGILVYSSKESANTFSTKISW